LPIVFIDIQLIISEPTLTECCDRNQF